MGQVEVNRAQIVLPSAPNHDATHETSRWNQRRPSPAVVSGYGAPMASPNPARGCLTSTIHWLSYLMFFPIVIAVVTVCVFGWLAVSSGGDLSVLIAQLSDGPEGMLTPGLLGFSTTIQLCVMVTFPAVAALILPRVDGEIFALPNTAAAALEKVLGAHAIARSRMAWMLAAAVGGLTIGLLPGWVAGVLMELEMIENMGWNESMNLIGDALSDTSAPGWGLMLFAVVVAAPVCEELVFRGYLWSAAERGLPLPAVWIVTSLAFALIHGNPIHIIAVLPIALFLGWLRWMSGSIWPCMLAHFLNNALATGMSVGMGPDADVGLIPCTAAFGVTLFAAGAAWTWCHQRPLEPTE